MSSIADFNYYGYTFPKASSNAQLLAQKPRKRKIQLPDNEANYTRLQNVEAYIAQEVGNVQKVPCVNCAGGHGQFKGKGNDCCVTNKGFFKGACAGCHHGTGGKRCTFCKYTIAIMIAHILTIPDDKDASATPSVQSESATLSSRKHRRNRSDSLTPPQKHAKLSHSAAASDDTIDKQVAKNVLYDHYVATARGMDSSALKTAKMALKIQKKAFKTVMKVKKDL